MVVAAEVATAAAVGVDMVAVTAEAVGAEVRVLAAPQSLSEISHGPLPKTNLPEFSPISVPSSDSESFRIAKPEDHEVSVFIFKVKFPSLVGESKLMVIRLIKLLKFCIQYMRIRRYLNFDGYENAESI